jgi:hypothetical protein
MYRLLHLQNSKPREQRRKNTFLEKLASDIVNKFVATTTFKLTDEVIVKEETVYHVAYLPLS